MSGPDGAPAPPKPRLKINISRSSSFAADANATLSTTASNPIATPSTGGTGGEGPRKVKLKLSSSQPPTPLDPPPTKTKAGRQPKPTQKLVDSKKRPLDEDDDIPLSAHPATKIKIRPNLKQAPTQLVVKPRGRPPIHPPGDGYDSEASDREIDPAIEEQFVLRMMPGEHCEYVRMCMENGKMGVSKHMGGADIQFKFFEEETRRAVMTVKGQTFAAVMVDLPTITEVMKTWDKKSLMKSADICQMLMIYQKVRNEEEAKKAPLPNILKDNFKWPHGLTPPMHDCVNRRFAKTISRKEIEDKEAEVERLLAEDSKAATTRWEWLDERQQDEEEDEDAEGEEDIMDYFQNGEDEEDEDEDDLEADLEAAFANDLTASAAGMEVTTPLTATPSAAALQQSIEDDESEEDEDDDDDDDDDEDLDEDAKAQRDEEQGVKDIIQDMQKQLAQRQAELAKTVNKILRSRIETQIKQLKSEIELKMSSIGMEMDD